jgi:hypothetical protein
VHRFGIWFSSNPNQDLFETGDNWNLDKLEVEYAVKGSDNSPAGTFLMYKSPPGKPVYRFKTKEEWETDPLNLKQ